MRTKDRRDIPDTSCGTVVSAQAHARLMTIERVETASFGDVASCAWFDGDSLHYNRVPITTLEIHPNIPKYCEVTRGLEVRLRSGGPVMTVLRASDRDGTALCEWDGPMAMIRRREFPIDCLNTSVLDMPWQ